MLSGVLLKTKIVFSYKVKQLLYQAQKCDEPTECKCESSAIWRSQAGRPTSPTSQAGYLPTSVYLSEKALLGGAIGPS